MYIRIADKSKNYVYLCTCKCIHGGIERFRVKQQVPPLPRETSDVREIPARSYRAYIITVLPYLYQLSPIRKLQVSTTQLGRKYTIR